MRNYFGYGQFTNTSLNTGQLDLRYVRITGNDSSPNFNQGLTVSGLFTVNSSGIFNNGLVISGGLILNGRQILITSSGEVYSPSVFEEVP